MKLETAQKRYEFFKRYWWIPLAPLFANYYNNKAIELIMIEIAGMCDEMSKIFTAMAKEEKRNSLPPAQKPNGVDRSQGHRLHDENTPPTAQ